MKSETTKLKIGYCGWCEELNAWIMGDCAFQNGRQISLEELGVEIDRWNDGESLFSQGIPQMMGRGKVGEASGLLEETIEEFGNAYGVVGLAALGGTLAYAAAPELLKQYGYFPGIWITGFRGIGKSTLASWLISMWGMAGQCGVNLSSCTPIGVRMNMANYSNLPLCFEVEGKALNSQSKLIAISSGFHREGPIEKFQTATTQRPLRTTPILVSETRHASHPLRQKFLEVCLKRNSESQIVSWMDEHLRKAPAMVKAVLLRREDYAFLVQRLHDQWMRNSTHRVGALSYRTKWVYGVAWAGLVAATTILVSPASLNRNTFRVNLISYIESIMPQERSAE